MIFYNRLFILFLSAIFFLTSCSDDQCSDVEKVQGRWHGKDKDVVVWVFPDRIEYHYLSWYHCQNFVMKDYFCQKGGLVSRSKEICDNLSISLKPLGLEMDLTFYSKGEIIEKVRLERYSPANQVTKVSYRSNRKLQSRHGWTTLFGSGEITASGNKVLMMGGNQLFDSLTAHINVGKLSDILSVHIDDEPRYFFRIFEKDNVTELEFPYSQIPWELIDLTVFMSQLIGSTTN